MATTLLLIDDDDLSREVLALLFAEDGYEVVSFASGDLALANLEEGGGNGIEIVLSDLQMPGTSGPALARALRAVLPASVRVVAMSGSPARAAELTGFDGFLLKPLTPADLQEALQGGSAGVNVGGTAEAGSGEANAAGTDAVLEEKAFAELSALLRPEQMSDLLALCFAEIERYTRMIGEAHRRGDGPALRAAAHALKGSVAMLGARELQALAGVLESEDAANQGGTLAEIPPAAERLRRMLKSRGLRFGDPARGDAHEDTIA